MLGHRVDSKSHLKYLITIWNSLISGASKDDAKDAEKQSPKDGTELAENTNQSSSTLEGLEDNDSKGASGNSHNSSHGTRLTRSRANQGTPGPSEQGSDSPSKLKNYLIKKNSPNHNSSTIWLLTTLI